MSHPHAPAGQLNELDPHHEAHEHGHTILRSSTLVGVLLALLVLTGITVGAAHLEGWVAETWHIHIPSIFNACVALSIAVVKAVLVFMFFMQLRYDNPLNSILMGFCFFAVGLFLFFSMIDLGNRAVIYPYKNGEIQLGGLGINTQVLDKDSKPIAGINTSNKPIVEWARLAEIERIGLKQAQGTLVPPLKPGETIEERYNSDKAAAHALARGAHHEHGPELSNSDRSRAPQSVGPALYAEHKAAPAEAQGHGGH